MQAAFAAHLAHCASCRPALPVCHMWHERHSSSALRAVLRLPAPWLLCCQSFYTFWLHCAHIFTCKTKLQSSACQRAQTGTKMCLLPGLPCPAPIASLRWAAKCPVLCALLLGSLKLNLSTLTRCGRQAAGGRRSWLCDGNVKQTIRTRSAIVTLSRSPSLSACLPLSLSDIALSLSIAPSHSLSVCAAKNAVVSLSQLPQPAWQLQLQLALLPRCLCLPRCFCAAAARSTLRKPEVVNIHAKTQPAFNVLARATACPASYPAPAPLWPRRMSLICNEKSINENAGKNTHTHVNTYSRNTVWQSAKMAEIKRTLYRSKDIL